MAILSGPNFPSGKFCSPIFSHVRVTPCMLTMTMLPERMLVRVHYLAHDRRRVLLFLFLGSKMTDMCGRLEQLEILALVHLRSSTTT